MGKPAAVLAATAALGAAVLSACERPAPNVTILSGSVTSVVRPQSYCFDAGHCRVSENTVAKISATQGGKVLVDVPFEVSKKHWFVQGGLFNGPGGAFVASTDPLLTAQEQNSHNVTMDVAGTAGTTYYLVIGIRSGTQQTATWIARVSVKD